MDSAQLLFLLRVCPRAREYFKAAREPRHLKGGTTVATRIPISISSANC